MRPCTGPAMSPAGPHSRNHLCRPCFSSEWTSRTNISQWCICLVPQNSMVLATVPGPCAYWLPLQPVVHGMDVPRLSWGINVRTILSGLTQSILSDSWASLSLLTPASIKCYESHDTSVFCLSFNPQWGLDLRDSYWVTLTSSSGHLRSNCKSWVKSACCLDFSHIQPHILF